jgi:hypothetical protein
MLPKAVSAWHQPPFMYDQTQLQQAFGGAEARTPTLSTTNIPGSPIDVFKPPLERAKADVSLVP